MHFLRIHQKLVRGIAFAISIAAVGTADSQETPRNLAPLSKIAFGSCLDQNKPQPILSAVLESKPQLFIFLGDNIYAQGKDLDYLRSAYSSQFESEPLRSLRSVARVEATWDDNDYGIADGGADFQFKEESKKEFLKTFEEPADSTRYQHPGIYQSRLFGPQGKRVQLILLDTRTFRSPLKKNPHPTKSVGPYVPSDDSNASILGEVQWAWLQNELKTPAEVRIVASSIQVLSGDHGYERWGNFPNELDRLLKLVSSIPHTFIISGDRHHAEVSRQRTAKYPMLEIVSSSLNVPRETVIEDNPYRIGKQFFDANFGLITIDWSGKLPAVEVSVRNERGETILKTALR